MLSSSPRKLFVLRATALAACTLAVFLLPYLFPTPAGISMASMAGFNNHVAVITLLLGSLLLGLGTRGLGLHFQPLHFEPQRARRAPLYIALLLVACLTIAVFLRARTSVPVSEAGYFLDRYAMHRLGYRLFRDISFDYGPLMFYPAIWIGRLFHLNAGDAFYTSWILNWLAGTALLWWLVERLPATPQQRSWLFCFAVCMLLPLLGGSGLNYTPLRYTLAPAAALSTYAVSRRSLTAALAAAVLWQAGILAYSPEQGIAFGMGTLLFFAVCFRGRALFVPLLSFACATAILLTAAKHFGLLQTMLDFSGGGYDLPLLFSRPVLTLVISLLLAGCIAVGAFFQGAQNRPELYLMAVALFAMPAAFGRADAGHIFVNMLSAVLVTLLVLARAPHTRWLGFLLAGVLVLPVLYLQLPVTLYGMFGPHVLTHLRQMLRPSTPDEQGPTRAAVQALVARQPEPQLFAPFGYNQPASQVVPLPIFTGRLFGYGLVSDRFPRVKLDELASRRDTWLLLPPTFDFSCSVPSAPWLHDVLILTLHPWYVPAMKHTTAAAQPLCAYIHQHFAPAPQPSPVPGWLLYRRMPPEPPAAL